MLLEINTMSFDQLTNDTQSRCTPPLLDKALFSDSGGYQLGRYCGLGTFEDDATCCFPCPIQEWIYPQQWYDQLRVPNYLSILSTTLCCLLLLSFAVLPTEATHRHYLTIGLVSSVLLISLSFSIPVSTNPHMCYNGITPNDMKSSMSCAWSGSFVTLGGLGCVVWVFLRSLWLHIRIIWDRDLGRKFMWGGIVFGTMVPIIFLIAMLAATGFSYRMGQTCLPNHDHAIVTFSAWLVIFAILAILLQAVTTGYCFFIYMRALRRERRASATDSNEHRHARAKAETWNNVKSLFLFQWRNILVSVFVIVGSLSFFFVFWKHDTRIQRVFHDPATTESVKRWLVCRALSSNGNEDKCRRFLSDLTVSHAAVLTYLILASLIGTATFVLLFRVSMLSAWKFLFHRGTHNLTKGRPPSPLPTSLENPDRYQYDPARKTTPLYSQNYRVGSPSVAGSSGDAQRYNGGTKSGTSRSASASGNGHMTEMSTQAGRPYVEMANEKRLPSPPLTQSRGGTLENRTLAASATAPRNEVPVLGLYTESPIHHLHPSSSSRKNSPQPHSRRLSQIQPETPAGSDIPRSYIPMRDAPSPPYSPSRSKVLATKHKLLQTSKGSTKGQHTDRVIHKSNSSKVRGRISSPVPSSFVHVGGSSRYDVGELRRVQTLIGVQRAGSQRSINSGLAMHPVEEDDLHWP